ncbi:unnamed protein product [Polarella glacialis]|uniref:EF-hand domain-containing protein n=1 Tax=Polarella glacialis TaxID=89957 RepID=A0A813GTH6_POLGL|nr:unnamed protein product [Polarella glacialis]
MLDTASWSGPVCDLMERKRHLEASSGTGLSIRVITVAQSVARKQDMRLVNACCMCAPSPEDTKLIVEGRDMVSQERLSSTIFDLILHNRKSLGVWPKTPSRVFRDWAIRISDLKREVKDLHKEAHSWNKRHKLHEIREPRTEPPDTKEKALLFWLEHQHHAWNLSTEPRGEEHSPRSKGLSTTNLKSPKSMAKTQSLGSLLSRPPQVPTRNGGPSARHLLPPVKDVCRMRYLRECHAITSIPVTLPFLLGISSNLDASGRDLTDPDMMAIAEALPLVERIDEVKLCDNARVTDRALAYFLHKLVEPSLARTLQKANFSGCLGAGMRSLEVIVRLVDVSVALRSLDLRHVRIGLKLQLPLCEALRKRLYLEDVNLADTRFGSGDDANTCQCLSVLLSGKIQTLDLSWNSFDKAAFSCIGECLEQNTLLKDLNLSSTAAYGTEGKSTPINYFLESLARVKPLARLDISMNRLDFRSALILEDSLQLRPNLKHLTLHDNPLGVLGIRSCLRVLSHFTSGLMHIESLGCFSGEEPGDADHNVFDSTQLAGPTYSLSLENPYHRALLRMLYKATERFNLKPEEVLQVNSCSPAFSHPSQKVDGLWHVPISGRLSVSFNLAACLQAPAFQDIGEVDFSGFLRRYFTLTRHLPGREKHVALLSRWKQINGCLEEQVVFLQAIGKEFSLSLAHLQMVATTSSLCRALSIQQLLPFITPDPGSWFLSQTVYSTVGECLQTRGKLKQAMNFNPDNPTGHYRLYLEIESDYAVAQQLILLEHWERLIDRKKGRLDTSEFGDGSHFRNEMYQGKDLREEWKIASCNQVAQACKSIIEWKLPSADTLQFDFSSTQQLPEGAEAIDQAIWLNLLRSVHRSMCGADAKIAALRGLSQLLVINSMQMRQLLGYFRKAEHRIEVLTLFFNRLRERHNAKLYRASLEFQDFQSLSRSIGFTRFFSWLQPENSRFELNLSTYDERLCLAGIVQLASREKETNLRDPEYILPDGTQHPLEMGVPRSWEVLDRVPTAGMFRGRYVCAPEDRNFNLRKQLCSKLVYMNVDETEPEVMWWTGLREATSDVIMFLMYLIANARTLEEGFVIFDGVGGNGVMTLRELEDGLESLGCKKFDGPEKIQSQSCKWLWLSHISRITEVFRYLDPGCEGSVSRMAGLAGQVTWIVLTQLWGEVELCITEFVGFLVRTSSVRTYGSDLDQSWIHLDLDNSGEISLDEWVQAVTRIGYFGPVEVVFNLIDISGDGAIAVGHLWHSWLSNTS